jgi:hypothetical protein
LDAGSTGASSALHADPAPAALFGDINWRTLERHLRGHGDTSRTVQRPGCFGVGEKTPLVRATRHDAQGDENNFYDDPGIHGWLLRPRSHKTNRITATVHNMTFSLSRSPRGTAFHLGHYVETFLASMGCNPTAHSFGS